MKSAPRAAIVLAFDVGAKKTGVAVGNRISGGARPLAILRGDRRRQLAAAAAMIDEWQPGLLLVGLAAHIDGKPHAMTARCRRFAASLEKQCALPVLLADERRSTEAARRLGGGGDVDDKAAAIILQNWLDSGQAVV